MSSIQIKGNIENDGILYFLVTNIKATLSSNFNFITKTFLIIQSVKLKKYTLNNKKGLTLN